MAHPAPTPDLIGRRYALGPVIGRGGSSVVRTAWDRRERRLLAAKVLRADAAGRARADHERAVRVDHPHLLTTIGHLEHGRHVVLLAPLATGGSLRDQVEQSGAPPAAAVHTALDQVLGGLTALHERGWVHRDLTPANVLLDAGSGPWRARLGDLGIAARVGTPQPPGEAPGTDGYLAPEAASGTPVDPRQDLYAVGVVGLRLLELGAATLVVGPAAADRSGDRARALAEAFARCADPDPRRRPGSAGEARALLRDAARLLPAAAMPAVPRRVPSSRPRCRRPLVGWPT